MLWIAILASFVAFLDSTVINVALPAIAAELGGGLTTQQWVVDAYLITLGSLILLAGSLSDVFGRMLVLRVGLIGFGATTLLCAIAPTAEILIVSRGLQGVAGALLVPCSLALIMSNFTGAAQAKAIGQWTAWTTVSFIIGPVLGGLFVDFLSWRFVFAINVIPIVVTLWMMHKLAQVDVRQAGTRIDLLGATLATIGVGGPVFALIEQSNFGWASPVILVPMALGVASLIGFLWRQHAAAQPLMPLSLFSARNFSMGNIATTFIYAALALGGFVIVVFLQETGGMSATVAGLALLPMTIMMIFLSSVMGGLSGRFGPRLFMTFGPIISAIGFLMMLAVELPVDYWFQLFPGTIIFGLGLATTVAPLTSAILGAIAPSQSGIASAVNNAISRVAGLVAIALVGVIVGTGLDLEGFRRGLIATAVLLIIGGLVSAAGIQNPEGVTPLVRRRSQEATQPPPAPAE